MTLYDISGKYMVDRLAGLSRMLTATSDHEREQFLEQLNNETQNAQ
ncbi:unnamed protein product, partial [Didymodactylos carnosus]